jgi:hypothetical protein
MICLPDEETFVQIRIRNIDVDTAVTQADNPRILNGSDVPSV